MKKKLIDILVASAVILTIAGVAGGTTLASYMDYQKYYEENMPEIDPADNATLLSIDAVLKDAFITIKTIRLSRLEMILLLPLHGNQKIKNLVKVFLNKFLILLKGLMM